MPDVVLGRILRLVAARSLNTFGRAVISATVLWEISRHVLVWYFATLSQVRTVYGSLTTVIVVLLTLELAAIVLLLGAQVIAEYERIEWEPVAQKPAPLHT